MTIIPYLRDIINDYKAPIKSRDPWGKIIDDDTYEEWKIQLTIEINFVSSLDHWEIRTMDLKSDNIEIMMGSETDDIIKELFESFWKDIRKN